MELRGDLASLLTDLRLITSSIGLSSSIKYQQSQKSKTQPHVLPAQGESSTGAIRKDMERHQGYKWSYQIEWFKIVLYIPNKFVDHNN
ncbi:hypothetical protein QVD17_21614 [Tagetes erecta]|uniref:Uncharacterized protein n=1 Tax=Tagetes erecta TaxID=13708 RepID=A0AAD8KC68_TARER|nr:hypothetical protein QVD17_21614 [Tagetes erecta]